MVLTFLDSLERPMRVDTVMVMELPSFPKVSAYRQPLVYKKWWKEIEACTKLPIPDEREDVVQFFYVDADEFDYSTLKLPLVGYTAAPLQQIYIVSNSIEDPSVVKHEMLHYLMFEYGINTDHPKELFRAECGVHGNNYNLTLRPK